MSKTQHTPGPWATGPVFCGQTRILADNGKCLIVGLPYAGQYGPDSTEEAANARLIAAAPDLLAALKECITDDGARCLAYGADTPTLRRRLAAINSVARSALAKAQGEGGAE